MDWKLEDWQDRLLAFTQRLVALRHAHPVFRRRRFLGGDAGAGALGDIGDVAWFRPNGDDMKDAHWSEEHARSVMLFLNGDAIPEPDRRGERVVDDSFLIAFNADHEPTAFTIPDEIYGDGWHMLLDTGDDQVGSAPSVFDQTPYLLAGTEFTVTERSIGVLRRPRSEET